NMNSINVNGTDVWSDGQDKVTITHSYNIKEGENGGKIFPNYKIANEEEAMEHFFEVCFSNRSGDTDEEKFNEFLQKFGYSKESYDDETQYNSAMYAWSKFAVNNLYNLNLLTTDKKYTMSFGKGSGFKFESYGSVDLTQTQLEEDELDDIVSNGGYVQSVSLPSISLQTGEADEVSEDRLMNTYQYITILYMCLKFCIVDSDTQPKVDPDKELLYYKEFEDSNMNKLCSLSEIFNDLSTIIGGEKVDGLIGFKPINDTLDVDGGMLQEYRGMLKTYLLAIVDVAEKLGIDKTINGYFLKDDAYGDDIVGSPSGFMSYLKQNSELYEGFKSSLLERRIIIYETITEVEQRSDSDKLSGVVDSSQIKIPLDSLNQDLGEDNIITEYWYAFPAGYISIQEFLGESSSKMLYHGIEKSYRYNSYEFSNLWHFKGKMPEQIIPYSYVDALYCSELANIKFAKTPGDISADNEEYSTKEQTITINWSAPEERGAELIGYQIAVVPKGAEVTEADFENLYGDEYSDLGDNYTVPYTTQDNSYNLNVGDSSKDVYIRGVNVIGSGSYKKITVNSELELKITGPDEVQAGSSDADYDTVNFENKNVEPDVTYSLKDNPDKISIDNNGRLTVDKDCELDHVTIISTGKSGTEYEGRTAQKEVKINLPEPEEIELKITGPDEVQAGSSNADYDTVDFENKNVEPDVTYSLKDNPDKISIDNNGR
ncbi:MAG: fibronectin type III domain-containing protein, partial [Lachnospiraceae bacterium]|nr:fibronectin type III domain-containing protein [Lachnospiraceae bacterium]